MRTAPEIAPALLCSRSASSAAVSRPESVTRRVAKTRAGIRGMPASTNPAANRSTNLATASRSGTGTSNLQNILKVAHRPGPVIDPAVTRGLPHATATARHGPDQCRTTHVTNGVVVVGVIALLDGPA